MTLYVVIAGTRGMKESDFVVDVVRNDFQAKTLAEDASGKLSAVRGKPSFSKILEIDTSKVTIEVLK